MDGGRGGMRILALRVSRVVIDVGLLAVAYVAAFLLRFDLSIPASQSERLLVTLPLVVAVKYLLLQAARVTRHSWRSVTLRDVIRLYAALAVSSALLLAGRFGLPLIDDGPLIGWLAIPAGVIVTDFALGFLALGGVRAARRITAERRATRRLEVHERPARTVLIGAGQAGLMVAREISGRPDLGIAPVAFLDDDPAKLGTTVYGIPVVGRTDDLAATCQRLGAERALITIAGAPGSALRRIVRLCEDAGVDTEIIPGVYEIVGGMVNLSQIRPVDIEDLLGREPVDLELETVERFLNGRTVLVTGAGGSIGSELCRHIARFDPTRLILVDRAENSLFEIDRELRARFPGIDIDPRLADICDARRMRWLFDRSKPAVIFHAAAHKHVPLMETNAGEAIKNNTLGTRMLADIAHHGGVDAFVMVSTDKAVNPSSVMGASKRAASMYIQALGEVSRTRFVTVRFGNVLGSTGSVVPIFKQQIAAGGPVTVTHPDMTRYFMTIPEASQLILQAGAMGRGGEVFVLDMGEPVRIVDLARDLIRLSGLRPDEDIEIVYTGVRPGEKLCEELSLDDENAQRTRHPKILIGRGSSDVNLPELEERLAGLAEVCDNGVGPDGVRRALSEIVREYPPERTSDRPPTSVGVSSQ